MKPPPTSAPRVPPPLVCGLQSPVSSPRSLRSRLLNPIPILVVTLSFTACSTTKPLRGGSATTSPTALSLTQSDNPAQPARQHQQTLKTRSYTIPAGSALTTTPRSQTPQTQPPDLQFLLSAPMPVQEHEQTDAATELGAAQKDLAREFSAKLSSLKPTVWVGLALFIFGIASLTWPPLKTLIRSVTTSAAFILGGLTLLILPTLILGNELLILAAVALAISAWFLAHRHGQLRGFLDANRNGIDDRLEPPTTHLPLNSQLTTLNSFQAAVPPNHVKPCEQPREPSSPASSPGTSQNPPPSHPASPAAA